ncbi:MAG: LysM peptidoglycan-binding domain-containing protein [Alphaproteobacteria bacterium]|nr:LysM peptidoglycan-binding domain-containing protein [Alphaproteobacteria bacterium]
MPHSDAITFEDLPRGDGSEGLTAVRDAVDLATARALYDEALSLAREGHLGQARERLRVLTALDPNDGDARLLLAKVLGAGGRWGDALSELDAATACGAPASPELRARVEAGRQEELRDDRGERVAARAQSELHALREEARRLRSENARLHQRARIAEGRARLWTTTTTVVSVVGALLLAATLLRGPSSPEAPSAVRDAPEAVPLPEEAPRAPAAGERRYVVQAGDTLSRISKQMYGTTARWKDILAANEATLGGRTDLKVGTELIIPE